MPKLVQPSILLIDPPFYRLFKDTYSLDRYPLSLGYLGGEIRRKTNWNVMVYNADFHPRNSPIKISYLSGSGYDNYINNLNEGTGKVWKEIEQTIMSYNPTVIGISVKSQNFKSALFVARLAKAVNKHTTVIMGGPHPSMVKADILKYPEVDIGVIGEGETTIVELLNSLEAGGGLNNINGIVYKNNGNIHCCPN